MLSHIIRIYIIYWYLLLFFVNGYGNLSNIEINSLYDLYTATNGDDWTYNEYDNDKIVVWNFSTPYINPCEDQWEGVYCNINCINDTICTVMELYIDAFNLCGTIPTSIGALSTVTSLSFGGNHLSFSIPSEIGKLTTLSTLILGSNKLSGTLPTNLAKLEALTHINCNENHLTGVFPPVFLNGNFSRLERLFLTYNSFTGHLPDFSTVSWANSLVYFALNNNILSGVIPSSVSSMDLLGFDVEVNFLTGKMPSGIWGLTNTYYIYISHNMLSGQFPSPPTSIIYPNMATISMISNRFTGIFLSGVLNEQFPHLYKIEITDNSISGSIPSTINQCSNLIQLYALNNLLSGSLPAAMVELTKLRQVLFENNYFTGTIPPLQAPSVEIFNLKNNLFTGSIPPTIYNDITSTTFAEFDVEYNSLSGTVPSIISSYTALNVLICSHNRLSGSLPSLGALTDLVSLALSSNYFTGVVFEGLNGTNMKALTTVDLSDNSFSGQLTPELFVLPEVQIIAASKNCFAGSLPTTVCAATNLVSLGLDGLTSGTDCISSIIFPVSTGIYISQLIGGTLPKCLFTDLTKLNVLMLSGNGFTGSLPDITSDLTNISLNHNMLSGSLPSTFQKQNSFKLFDMSYNKISGTISGMTNYTVVSIPNNSAISLHLEVNRLSGNIPHSFHTSPYINILSGNYFACSDPSAQLPENDPDYETYSCGSTILDYSVDILLISLMCMIFGVLSYVVYTQYRISGIISDSTDTDTDTFQLKMKNTCQMIIQSITKYYIYIYNLQFLHQQADSYNVETTTAGGVSISISTMEIRTMLLLLTELRHLTVRTSVVAMCILMPAYCIFAAYYATHTYQYGWYLSVAFTASYVEGVALLLLWSSFLSYCYYLLHQIHLRLCAFHTRCSLHLGFLKNRKNGRMLSEMVQNADVNNNNHNNSYNNTNTNINRSEFFDANTNTNTNSEARIDSQIIHVFQWMCDLIFSSFCFSCSDSKFKQFTWNEFVYLYGFVPVINGTMVLIANSIYVYAVLHYSFMIVILSQIVLVLFKTVWNAKVVSSLVRNVQHANDIGFWYFGLNIFWKEICLQYSCFCNRNSINNDKKNGSSESSEFGTNDLKLNGDGMEIEMDGDVLLDTPRIYTTPYAMHPQNTYVEKCSQKEDEKDEDELDPVVFRLTNVNPEFIDEGQDRQGSDGYDSVVDSNDAENTYAHYHIQVLLLVFNNIVAPIVVTSAGDPNCFLNVLVPPEAIHSSLPYPSCSLYGNNECFRYTIETIEHSYTPPFMYYYQCSTSILTAYIPVYIVMYIVLGILLPLFYHFVIHVSKTKTKSETKSETHDKTISVSITPTGTTGTTGTLPTNPTNQLSFKTSCSKVKIEHDCEVEDANYQELKVYADLLGSKKFGLFRAPNTCCNFVSHIAVLFTFGVVYPPLGLIIVMYFYNSTWTWQSLLGKLLEMPYTSPMGDGGIRLNSVGKVLINLEKQCCGIWKVLHRSRYILTTSAGMFYALFLVDIVGDDATSFVYVIWMPILMICVSYMVGRTYLGIMWFDKSLKISRPRPVEHTPTRSVDDLELVDVHVVVENPIH